MFNQWTQPTSRSMNTTKPAIHSSTKSIALKLVLPSTTAGLSHSSVAIKLVPVWPYDQYPHVISCKASGDLRLEIMHVLRRPMRFEVIQQCPTQAHRPYEWISANQQVLTPLLINFSYLLYPSRLDIVRSIYQTLFPWLRSYPNISTANESPDIYTDVITITNTSFHGLPRVK